MQTPADEKTSDNNEHEAEYDEHVEEIVVGVRDERDAKRDGRAKIVHIDEHTRDNASVRVRQIDVLEHELNLALFASELAHQFGLQARRKIVRLVNRRLHGHVRHPDEYDLATRHSQLDLFVRVGQDLEQHVYASRVAICDGVQVGVQLRVDFGHAITCAVVRKVRTTTVAACLIASCAL